MSAKNPVNNEIIDNLVDILNEFIESVGLQEARAFLDSFFGDSEDDELALGDQDITTILNDNYDEPDGEPEQIHFIEFEEVESEFEDDDIDEDIEDDIEEDDIDELDSLVLDDALKLADDISDNDLSDKDIILASSDDDFDEWDL